MAKNKIEDLRDHLFETLEALKDTDRPLDEEIKRAKTVVEVSAQIIDSARVEVKYAQVASEVLGTDFLDRDAKSQFFEPRLKHHALNAPHNKKGSAA